MGLDAPPMPQCLSDDDCQGLALTLPVCQEVLCDQGSCVQVAVIDGSPCHTDALCFGPGLCLAGACDEPPAACDDGDPCTGTTCEPTVGCLFEPLHEVPCDDGDPCTTTDLCAEGVCVGEGALACDDGNPCTQGACDPWFGCVYQDLDGSCDDGDPCTGGEHCVYGVCEGGAPLCDCDTDEDCADLVNACFGAWTCDTEAMPRICVPVPETEAPCPDMGPCQAGACDPATEICVPVPKEDGVPCSDPLGCVEIGECQGGVCVGGPLVCEGIGGECTAPLCVPGEGCVDAPIPGPCDDGDLCTVNDWCVDGACLSLATDCGAVPPGLFRITSLQWDGPGLSYSSFGGLNIALEEAVDVAMAQALTDAYAPLDLLIGLDPLDTGAAAGIRVSTGPCQRGPDGLVLSCPWSPAAIEIGPASWCLDDDPCEAISGAPPAPSFGAEGEASGALALAGILGGSLVPAGVEVTGHLEGLPEATEITVGTLSLFVPEAGAAQATIDLPLMAPLALDGLLDPASMASLGGLQGWWIHLGFQAARTPITQ